MILENAVLIILEMYYQYLYQRLEKRTVEAN